MKQVSYYDYPILSIKCAKLLAGNERTNIHNSGTLHYCTLYMYMFELSCRVALWSHRHTAAELEYDEYGERASADAVVSAMAY